MNENETVGKKERGEGHLLLGGQGVGLLQSWMKMSGNFLTFSLLRTSLPLLYCVMISRALLTAFIVVADTLFCHAFYLCCLFQLLK